MIQKNDGFAKRFRCRTALFGKRPSTLPARLSRSPSPVIPGNRTWQPAGLILFFAWFSRSLPQTIQQVINRPKGMMPEHSGADLAHNLLDFYPHDVPVTMHRTFTAGGLALLKRAEIQTTQGIIAQIRTLLAQLRAGVMVQATVEGDHRLDRGLFPFNSSEAHHTIFHVAFCIFFLPTT